MKYLYGASVQGIQGFIFQTNELKDIVGASELVAQICTTFFQEMLGCDFNKESLIIGAAGNVRYCFDDKDACARAVLHFPRKVMTAAPGITISQAVVEMPSGEDFSRAINDLESKLKIQRNQPHPSLTIGFLGMKRSNKTGLPLITYEEKGAELDMTTSAKREYTKSLPLAKKSFYGADSDMHVDADLYPFDITKLTDSNDWIAVVHADGNGLGQIVQKIGSDMERYKQFSQLLDQATERAANDAFNALQVGDKESYPLRPIVLGGDDMTVIIRGSLAIEYAEEFIRQFEYHTGEGALGNIIKKATGLNSLTACAGVAFIKSSYPFHYGYTLAEELCKVAKKDAKAKTNSKGYVPSCLMFHKVEDSYVQSYEDIVKRVLTPTKSVSLNFGPYYLREQTGYFTIEELKIYCERLKETDRDGVKAGLRQWLSLIHRGEDIARQHQDRMMSVFRSDNEALVRELCQTKTRQWEEKDSNGTKYTVTAYPTFDILSLYSIINIVTNE